MTARTDAQSKHERRAADVLEIDLDTCTNTYGVSPCTAGRVNSGTAQSGSASNIRLAAGASAVNNFYVPMTVRLTGGTGAGQERKIIAYNGATKDATPETNFSPAPDGTTTYDVIDRPNACYNTFATCQDKANFVKGVKTVKFCTRGMPIPPGELVRPYIESVNASPTEADPKAGIGRSSKTSIDVVDEPSTDYELDPYFASRLTPAAGTYWTRLLARNPNYVGRWSRFRRGYPVDPWDWNTFQTELYQVETIKLKGAGKGSIVLKDPIKLADRAKVPAPTDGKLTADITSGATSFSVDSGKGAQYGSGVIYVRVGDEIMSGIRTTDTWTSVSRGLFGTTAVAHKQNDKVQLCKVFTATNLTDVIIALLNAAGISNTYIDTAQFASEDTRWLSTKYQLTVCLSEPEDPTTYIGELCREANAMTWWHPVEQKQKFKVNMPESATTTIREFNESEHIIKDSVQIDFMDDQRLTASVVDYALKSPVANRDQADSYLRGVLTVDTDAESANEYNDHRVEVLRSRFLGTGNDVAAVALGARIVSWRRNAPAKIRLKLDPKDYTIAVGDLIDLNLSQLVNAAGNNKPVRVRVVKLKDNGKDVEIECLTTKFKSRYAFIAPNGTPDYPTDQVYAHICRTTPSQTMGNGDDPYLII